MNSSTAAQTNGALAQEKLNFDRYQVFEVIDGKATFVQGFFTSHHAEDGARKMTSVAMEDVKDDVTSEELKEYVVTALTDDGYFVNVETGEPVAMLVADDADSATPRLDAGFSIDSPERLDWYMRKRFDHEAEISYIQNRIDALTRNLEAMKSEKYRRLESLNKRFEEEARAFVDKELEKQKGKTYRTAWGSVATRTVPASVQVHDLDKAYTVLTRDPKTAVACEEKIVRKVLPSALPKDFKADIVAGNVDPDEFGLTINPARTSYTFHTGIEQQLAKREGK